MLFFLQFARHIKKSEGQKTPKVELQISIYGVKILDPKTKVGYVFICDVKRITMYGFRGLYCLIL
mgnify:CR=1 FL=1